MKVHLAGYNYDLEFGENIRTPETLSAAYARISRSEKSVERLREEACRGVQKARKSNEKIIFGLGHASVAEHAVFNFDIIDISRYLTEMLQHHRLASFTEKSQRYVKFNKNFYIPSQIRGTKLENEFESFCRECFEQYSSIIDRCHSAEIEKDKINEDARYVLPLSTYTQMGMTVNGRTLEYMIAVLNSRDMPEARDLGHALYSKVSKLAPSIIKYTEGREHLRHRIDSQGNGTFDIELLDYTPNANRDVAAMHLFESGIEYSRAVEKARSREVRQSVFKDIFSHMEMWDRPPRVFEHSKFTFGLSLSASAYAQLKRHRMSSQTVQAYNFSEKPVIPGTLTAAGADSIIHEMHEKSVLMAEKLGNVSQSIMPYAALNSTGRNVIITMNAREIYHFSRLRSDRHAQWEIRDISDRICSMVKEIYPDMFMLLGGKDSFSSIRGNTSEL